jgi:membrane protein
MRRLDPFRLGIKFTLREFFDDRGVDRSAALAYISLLSLVPLLATVAALYRAFFGVEIDRIIELVTVVLPYAPGAPELVTIAETLTEFVNRATTLGYIGSLIFLAIAFRLFLSVETTFNDIWQLRARRAVSVRVFSFTMLVFWGPVVIGLGSSLLLWMGHQSWAPSRALILSIGQLLIPLVGLTMVYWLAPHTGVHIRAALVGGVIASVGLHLLRRVFVRYLERFSDINIIYGSLTLAVLFLVSLFLFWMLVILGAEASYVVQNFHVLKLEHDGGQRLGSDPALTALALLTECYRRIEAGEPAPTLDTLETTLHVSHPATRDATERLVDLGLLALTGPERDTFVPGRDASQLSPGAVLEACSVPAASATLGDDHVARRLGHLVEESEAARRAVLERGTFADLLAAENSEEEPGH